MIRRATLSGFAASLWLFTSAQAIAVEQTPTVVEPDEDEMADSADERWGLNLGIQGDRSGTRGLTSALTYDVRPATTLRLSGHATDYYSDPPVGSPGVPRTIGAAFGATHHLGRFAIDADVGHWIATNVVKADEINLGGSMTDRGFSGGLRTGYRRSTFAAFATSRVTDFGNGVRAADVTAACRLQNTNVGVDLGWQGARFAAHARTTSYAYENVRCAIGAAGLGSTSVSENAAAFAALAGNPLSRLQFTALPVIGDQPALARALTEAGVSWTRHDKVFAVDYLRQQGYFTGGVGTALYATLSAKLGGSTGIDLSIGRTRGDGTPRGLFGGIGLRSRF